MIVAFFRRLKRREVHAGPWIIRFGKTRQFTWWFYDNFQERYTLAIGWISFSWAKRVVIPDEVWTKMQARNEQWMKDQKKKP